MMSGALLDGVAAYLAAAGLGSYDPAGPVGDTWPIYLDWMPDKPDRALCLATYPGAPPDPLMPYDETRLQVRVRGDADTRTSRGRADAVYSALHAAGRLILPGGVWLQLALATTSGPLPLGPDGAGRQEHTCNFEITWANPTVNRPAL